MNVFLSNKAFVSIVVAAIEAYHDECLGLLLGYRSPGQIIVEGCVVYQSAKRKPSEVEPVWNRELKIIEVIPKLTQLQSLGYFHSHTQWGRIKGKAKLSESDKDSMGKNKVEVIAAINDSERSVRWHRTNDGLGLAGTIGRYHVALAAFYKREDEKVSRCKISCPYALGFDYVFSKD